MPLFFGKKDDPKDGSDPSVFEKYSIDFTKKFGEGGYGATFAAADKASGEPLACKVIDTRRMKMDAIKKECQILETLTHPNVISVKAHSLGEGKHAHLYFIFMEVAAGGELFDQVIERGANAMTEPVARAFFLGLLDGVAYCHLAGVAHRDLKLENVLLTADGKLKNDGQDGRLKIIDFGLSHVYPRGADGKSIDRSKPLKDVCGSKSYAAPEVLAARGYDGFAADVWSLGVCLFAMLSGFFPLDEASPNDWRYPKLVQAQQIGRSTTATVYAWYRRQCKHLSPEVVSLLDGLLHVDPNKRLSMEATRAHPWVAGSKFGQAGAGAADQGSYNVSSEVGDEGPTFRGLGAIATSFEDEMIVDDDDAPVYRSLGGGVDGEAPPPPAMPVMRRMRAMSNLAGPSSGMAALDDLLNVS